MSTLEQRVQRWEDTEAIRRLKFEYGRLIDEGLGGEGSFPQLELLDQFTDDAVWEANYHGRFEGREAIRDFLASVSGSVTFSLHYMMNPVIRIADSGAEATARWISFETLTVDGKAVWLATDYNDVLTKESGHWQFRHVTAHIYFMTPFEEGWVARPFVD
jgi:hypothetical protein